MVRYHVSSVLWAAVELHSNRVLQSTSHSHTADSKRPWKFNALRMGATLLSLATHRKGRNLRQLWHSRQRLETLQHVDWLRIQKITVNGNCSLDYTAYFAIKIQWYISNPQNLIVSLLPKCLLICTQTHSCASYCVSIFLCLFKVHGWNRIQALPLYTWREKSCQHWWTERTRKKERLTGWVSRAVWEAGDGSAEFRCPWDQHRLG